MSKALESIFSRIDHRGRRADGSILNENWISRSIRHFTIRHIVLGTLLLSACMTLVIVLFFVLFTAGRHVANAVIVGVICMVVTTTWNGLLNR
jgi:hypothetical protein